MKVKKASSQLNEIASRLELVSPNDIYDISCLEKEINNREMKIIIDKLLEILKLKNKEIETRQEKADKTLKEATFFIERECQRLAYDLHDGPAQTLSSALLQVDIIEDMCTAIDQKQELNLLKDILRQCLDDLRTAIFMLKPNIRPDEGLSNKIKRYVKHFSELTNIRVNYENDDNGFNSCEKQQRNVSNLIETNVFRIIQEALNNVRKHSKATQVNIKLSITRESLSCLIEDNGTGFDVASKSSYSSGKEALKGYGLASMRYRVEQFSGSFEIKSEPLKGTSIFFSIPLHKEL